MHKLAPFIDRFVHDVLRVLRGATLDELSELFSEPDRPVRLPRATAIRAAERPRRARRSTHVPAPAERHRAAKTTLRSLARSIVADITDPERLLAATAPGALPAVRRAPVAADEDAPPASGERVAHDVVRSLRAGETLVRASGSGIVIRRAKRG